MQVLSGFSPIARALIVTAAIAIVLFFMQAAASIIAPTLLAAFVAIVATPPLHWMQRKGLPKWGALALVVLVLLDVGSIVALVTTGALEGLRDSLPGYQERLILLSDQLGSWLEGVGVANAREAVPDVFDPAIATSLVRMALSNVSGTFANGLLVLLAVILCCSRRPACWPSSERHITLLLWGWVLGTVGVFLSVPLTMALMIALDAAPQTRPIAILLGPDVTEKPEPEEETSAAAGATD